MLVQDTDCDILCQYTVRIARTFDQIRRNTMIHQIVFNKNTFTTRPCTFTDAPVLGLLGLGAVVSDSHSLATSAIMS